MVAKTSDLLKQFSPGRILLPVVLGLSIVGYTLYGEWVKSGLPVGEALDRIAWTPRSAFWIALAFVMMALRDFGYIWQLRILTDRALEWRACFEIILLWDFFAAVSPSMVGGAAVAVFMLVKEQISIGRSTAIVFTTVFLDQVFYTSLPFFASLFVPQADIFAPLNHIKSELLGTSMMAGFWAAWGGLVVYLILLIAALFVAPHWINGLLTRLFMLPMLRRWRWRGLHMVNDLFTASRDLRDKKSAFWFQVWLATSLAWIGRYLVLNCVLAAFSPMPMSSFDHWLAIGRQAVLWIIMVLSPTPGSAGVAELGFSWLFGDFVPAGAALTLAVLWRLISYYPYLIIGVPVMTRWVRRVYGADVRHPRVHID
ncbi:lysylphosphatidylglycerol synthase transmembrane domain-containing protein [Methylocaldum sp. MU1018]